MLLTGRCNVLVAPTGGSTYSYAAPAMSGCLDPAWSRGVSSPWRLGEWVKWAMNQWVGLRENRNRKQARFSHEDPVIFPLNQSIEWNWLWNEVDWGKKPPVARCLLAMSARHPGSRVETNMGISLTWRVTLKERYRFDQEHLVKTWRWSRLDDSWRPHDGTDFFSASGFKFSIHWAPLFGQFYSPSRPDLASVCCDFSIWLQVPNSCRIFI